jgi:hypothetical protein
VRPIPGSILALARDLLRRSGKPCGGLPAILVAYKVDGRRIPARPLVIPVADNPLDAALLSPLLRTSATLLQHRKYGFREQILTILPFERFVLIPASNLLKSSAQQPI